MSRSTGSGAARVRWSVVAGQESPSRAEGSCRRTSAHSERRTRTKPAGVECIGTITKALRVQDGTNTDGVDGAPSQCVQRRQSRYNPEGSDAIGTTAKRRHKVCRIVDENDDGNNNIDYGVEGVGGEKAGNCSDPAK
jgi:hypothetical protein